MTTPETVLLIVVGVLLSLFIIICIAAVFTLFKLLQGLRRVVEKAEDVADSVEAAAEMFRDTSGRLALVKLLRNIVQIMNGGRKK